MAKAQEVPLSLSWDSREVSLPAQILYEAGAPKLSLTDEGTGVLLVSSELDEIVGLSDRIAVIYRGEIVEIVPAGRATKEYLGLLMAGIKPEEAVKAAPKPEEEIKVERVF